MIALGLVILAIWGWFWVYLAPRLLFMVWGWWLSYRGGHDAEV